MAEGAVDWRGLDVASVDFFHDTLIAPAEITDRLLSYEVLVRTRERTRFPAQVLPGLPNLKLIAGTGCRQANVDMDKAAELGIEVMNTSGSRCRRNSTAEFAWAFIMGVSRHIAWEDRQIREGRWQTRRAEGLGGNKLGILGMGKLVLIFAGYGNYFDMDVIAWVPTSDAERADENSVELVLWDELFSESDILSIHLPLTDLSRGWVTAREFGLMKDSAFLVNTSRGPIVDESDLITALSRGQIAGLRWMCMTLSR